MIRSYQDYLAYLEADRLSLKRRRTLRNLMFDRIWKFQRLMRQLEYLTNCNKSVIWRRLVSYRYGRLGRQLGYSIPINVFGPGLAIAHIGTIVVNEGAAVGANCRLHVCVNIGTEAGKKFDAPEIGDNCYIAPGAKIFGKIVIGGGTVIGANAVVNKSFPEGNVSIGGVPAKVISGKGSESLITKGYLS